MHFPPTTLCGGRHPDFLKILKIMICYKSNKYLFVLVTKRNAKLFQAKYRPIPTKCRTVGDFVPQIYLIFLAYQSTLNNLYYTTWQGLRKNFE